MLCSVTIYLAREVTGSKTIAFFPEAPFGPSINFVGITQHLRERGHNPVFIADRSFTDQFKRLVFRTHG